MFIWIFWPLISSASISYCNQCLSSGPSLATSGLRWEVTASEEASAHSIKTFETLTCLCIVAVTNFIMYRTLALAASLLSAARGQLVGTETTETHPSMSWQSCTAKGSCTTKNGKITIDANWRWLHVKGG